jgi:hypothetical protein
MAKYDDKSVEVNLDGAMAAAETAVRQWDGWDVRSLLQPLQRVQAAAKGVDCFDRDTALLELLNERSTWPRIFEEEVCPFALVADPCGRYISWEYWDNRNWLRSRLELGRFPAEPAEKAEWDATLNFRALLSAIGIDSAILAEHLSVVVDTVHRWEANREERTDAQPAPRYAVAFLLAWRRLTTQQREAVADDLETMGV